MNERYKVIGKSVSCHCCFEATVIDTQTISFTFQDGAVKYETVCECFDTESAELVCEALNKTTT